MIDDTNTNGGGGYYQTNERDTAVNYRTSTAGIALKTSHSVAGSIRSLPSSLYRGSPERNMIQQNGGYPIQGSRSPERNMDNNHQRPTSRISSSSRNQNYSSHHSHHHHHQYMPDGSVSTAPTPTSEKSYDLSSSQKLRMANYLASKRSLTACDEPIYAANIVNGTTPKASLTSSQSVKNRQLHMGKAKIDLETQQSNSYLITTLQGFRIRTLYRYERGRQLEEYRLLSEIIVGEKSSQRVERTSQHNKH